MPLPPSRVARKPLHKRTISVSSFEREDGCWDIEAELIDTKAYDFYIKSGAMHKAGDPVHHMHLRVTIDPNFTITSAQAAYDAAPYDEQCAAIAPDYQNLVGLNLLRRFRHEVKSRFARTAGCTHLTELTYILPTVAIQTMAGERRKQRAEGENKTQRPFEIDGCHALRASGPVVKEHYPFWYAKSG